MERKVNACHINPPLCDSSRPLTTRRDFLTRSALGIGGLGLAALLSETAAAGEAPLSPLAPRQPHIAPKARRVIQIFCEGGPSQIDTFDPKPALEKHHAVSAPNAFSKLVDRLLVDTRYGERWGRHWMWLATRTTWVAPVAATPPTLTPTSTGITSSTRSMPTDPTTAF